VKKVFYIVFCTGSLAALHANAQSNTRLISSDTSARALANSKDNAAPQHRILLVPFTPKMCMSEIGKDVHTATNLNFDQITQAFRKQLDLAMYSALRKSYIPVSLLQGKDRSDSVLGYIYSGTGYHYDPVPGAVVDVGAPDNRADAKDKYVNKGQLQVPVDYTKRFMNVSFSNQNLLTELSKKYNTDTYVFINELDIQNVNNPTENLNDATYRRQVTVHYSILDKDGKSIAKGLSTTYFPFGENDPKEIGEKYFTLVAHDILKNYAQGITINNLAEQQKKQASTK
jgi:hypothetical protein